VAINLFDRYTDRRQPIAVSIMVVLMRLYQLRRPIPPVERSNMMAGQHTRKRALLLGYEVFTAPAGA
jgi:hypothetical protein